MKKHYLFALPVVVALTLVAGPAFATGDCVVGVIHHEAVDETASKEFRWMKVIPGVDETFHAEYRFQTRSKTYGWVEHKFIYSRWDFIDGGQTRINETIVSGHWQSTGNQPFWHAIPDSIINAVWGSGGIPDSVLGGSEAHPAGSVSLTTYGAPPGAGSAPYYASKAQESTGYTQWGPWSDWSTTDPGLSDETKNVESRQVSNNDDTPEKTVYYVENGEPTSDLTDANWTPDEPEGWTFVDDRAVGVDVHEPAWDEKVYGECELAETGANEAASLVTIIGGVALLAAGVALVLYRRKVMR